MKKCKCGLLGLIPVVARCKARVWGRSLAGIAGSNPAGDMDVLSCLYVVRGVCVGLITLPERSHLVWCVFECYREAVVVRRPCPTRAVLPWKKESSTGGMTQRITQGPGEKPSLSATASLINPTQTGLGSNPGFLDDRTVTKHLRLGAAGSLLLETGSLIMKLLVVAVLPSGRLLKWLSVE